MRRERMDAHSTWRWWSAANGRTMSESTLRSLVDAALRKLRRENRSLFELDVSEWAIAHRLAVYLEEQLIRRCGNGHGWHVDREYNRQGNEDISTKQIKDGVVRPDISIHHRGELAADHNPLVIEVKKHLLKDESHTDYTKLVEYTSKPSAGERRRFQYLYGLSLQMAAKGDALIWFKGGERLSEERR